MKLKQELKKKQIPQNWKSARVIKLIQQNIWDQKDTLHCLRNNRYWNLKKIEIFDKFKQDIENEAFIILNNKIYGDLENNIKNEQIVSRLEDKGYYDSRINFTEDLKELTDKSQITLDIKKLNQTLLMNKRYVDQLDKKRKTCYHNNYSDEENFLTRMSDNTKPVRNASGNINVQISFIDTYTKSKAGKSLFDILYYSWAIGKDDKFLLTKYTKTKIEETKILIKNIDNYICIKIYNNDDDKKEYLHKIFKILVTRELDDIEDDDDIIDINNVFDSLNFTF
ncbi:hypothetical protein C2G38_2196743 [Gigaspora rosea]|uniref:Uncharacterized protein n=1 Tax=Gigaspora rosea TaxID=44941 RepID=A0A397UWV3_9GLOM|nr:hypothetical protein C2G38_2196743 [Gigaspora rosea]